MRIFFIVLVLFLVSSCRFGGDEPIKGNGKIVSQQKQVEQFDAVNVSGQVVLHISQGATPSARIDADENLMEFIEVSTRGNTLVIRIKDGYDLSPSKAVTAFVTAPVYRRIEASGQCEIIGQTAITGSESLSIKSSGQVNVNMEVNVPKLTADISGQGALNIRGRAPEFESSVSGSGSLKCFDLVTDNTDLDISGASNVEITVNNKLDVNASGASTVVYRGNANVSNNSSGASTVKKAG